MIFLHAPEIFGPAYQAFRDAAVSQEFLAKDPTGRDDVLRSGLRTQADVCFYWEGFDQFWSLAGEMIIDHAQKIHPADYGDKPRGIEMTRMSNGGYFSPHVDAGYSDIHGPTVTFVYYVGDRMSFTGGELKIGESIIDPTDDSLVMFSGADMHEVLPISGDGAQRITINGYLATK